MRTFALLLGVMTAVAAGVTVEGVDFTPEQEKRVLLAVNTASFETLTFTYDVFDFKSQNIIDGRYYSNLAQLGRVSGVTPFVLRLLRDKEVTCSGGFPSKAAELASTLSFSELKLQLGLWRDEDVQNIFVNRPYCTQQSLEQVLESIQVEQLQKLGEQRERTDGSSCTIIAPCAEGFLCAHLTNFGFLSGTCRRVWQGGEFSASGDATPTSTVTVNVPKFGGGMVASDVLLSLSTASFADRQSLKSVKIEAVDPPGTRWLVWDGPSASSDVTRLPSTFVVPNSQDDTITGNWNIVFSNPAGTATGTITDIKLVLTARFD